MSYNRGLSTCARIARDLVDANSIAIKTLAGDDSLGKISVGMKDVAADKDAFCEAVTPIVRKTVRKLRVETLGVIMCAARKDNLSAALFSENGRTALRAVATDLLVEHMLIIIQHDFSKDHELAPDAVDDTALLVDRTGA